MKKIVEYLFELNHLKNIKHEGWRLAGVSNPDSVAEHCLGATQIAFILAKLENHPNPHFVATMCAFHDIAETRIGDVHKLGIKYISRDESAVTNDQLKPLNEIGSEIKVMWEEFESRKTPAAQIVKDADRLEQAVQARIYILQGHKEAQDWINNIRKSLLTKSGKKLLEVINKSDPYKWWKGKKLIGKDY